MGQEASPEREDALRADLVREIRRRTKSVAFVRLHAIYQHPDLCMPLRAISRYTVIIDTSGKTEEAIPSPPCPAPVSARSAPAWKKGKRG